MDFLVVELLILLDFFQIFVVNVVQFGEDRAEFLLARTAPTAAAALLFVTVAAGWFSFVLAGSDCETGVLLVKVKVEALLDLVFK